MFDMSKIKPSYFARLKERKISEINIFILLIFGMIGSVIILNYLNPLFFLQYFGDLNPLLAVIFVSALGLFAIRILLSISDFRIFRREDSHRLLFFFGIASLLAFLMILVDIFFKFPEGINVEFPYSLLFYPLMGFVVGSIFHLMPLMVLISILKILTDNKEKTDKLIWLSLPIIAIFEPIYQQLLSTASHFSLEVEFYIGFHIWVINLIQLYLFKRNDFLSMYYFRIIYYFFWHILWGFLRLNILF
jgi:hypothetical protein